MGSSVVEAVRAARGAAQEESVPELSAQIIVDTYAKAIEFLGVCAGQLAAIDLKALLAAASSIVPGLNVIVWADVIDTIIDAFGELVTEFSRLLAFATMQIGQFFQSSTGFAQISTNFVEIPDLPANTGVDNQKQWKIEPDVVPK